MAYFTQAFVDFFRNLADNNSTAWFDANRKTYESQVKKPFALFVQEMIALIAKEDPEVGIEARDAIFRINKDIRFAKDKTPYKNHVAANISKYGRKDKAYPGFYFQLSHTGAEIVGGAYLPEKDILQKIRGHIADDLKGFKKIIDASGFKKHYGQILGESAKRIPEEWKIAHEQQPLIANKQFYYQATLPASVILDKNLPGRLMAYYTAAKEVNAFLKKASA